LDRALRDTDAELQELASNSFRSPEPVLGRHAVDEGDHVRPNARFAWPSRAGLPTPEKSESLPVPSQQRFGLDQQQGMAPLAIEAREQYEQTSLVDPKGRAFDGARSDDELLPARHAPSRSPVSRHPDRSFRGIVITRFAGRDHLFRAS
jgi:hypothetical protein